ncbi:MAG: hypothetical protein JW832_16705, partial [Deltaproteobacteria bacterium]|nr:hypothetical protein [Deltaproteobacteria bacterium]
MNRGKHRLLTALFFFCGCISTCATASLLVAASVTDNATPSHTALTPAEMPDATNSYSVRQGDCLGKILREVFKLPDEVIFSPKTCRAIQKVNPHIHDLDALQAGEKLFVPSSILLQGRQSLVPDGEIQSGPSARNHAEAPAAAPNQKKGGGHPPASGDTVSQQNEAQSAPAIHITTDETPIKEDSLPKPDELQHEKKIKHLLIDFVKAFDGYENTRCMKTLTIENGGTIVMDCSKFPVYEFPWGARIVMDYGSQLPETVRQIISAHWDNTEVITAGYTEKIETIFSRVIDGCGLLKNETGNRYTVSRDDIQSSVSGNWIVYKDHPQNIIFVITIANGECLRVPEGLRAYLSGIGIHLLNLSLTEKQAPIQTDYFSPEREVLLVKADPVNMTDMILELSGITPQKNVRTRITPKNARGITFEIIIDRKFELAGKTCFIDFKNLSSNIASMLNNNGNKIIQIDLKTDDYINLIHELLDFCANGNYSS